MVGDLLANMEGEIQESTRIEGVRQYSSLSQVWALLAEGIVKEADKLACLVLFLLFQFHSTVRACFGQCGWATLPGRGDKVRHIL